MGGFSKMKFKKALIDAETNQGQLARKIGVAPSTLSTWIGGLTTPPRNWIQMLEEGLNLKIGSLRE